MSNMIPQYDTKIFTDIWNRASEFLYDYKHVGIPTTISDTNANTLYYLLYARYANNPLANYDEEQFKYRVFSIIFQYGPTWEKRLDIQAKLRALTDEQLVVGLQTAYSTTGSANATITDSDTTINNHAFNPSTAPTTTTTSELDYIDQQNVAKKSASTQNYQNDSRSNTQNITKPKLDAYAQLWDLLDNDVTSEFLDKFKKLFKQFVAPERPLLYVTETEEDDE